MIQFAAPMKFSRMSAEHFIISASGRTDMGHRDCTASNIQSGVAEKRGPKPGTPRRTKKRGE